MSFRCEMCNKVQEAGVAPVVLVTEQRRVTYLQRMKGKKVIDPGGVGLETVTEVNICSRCASKNEQESSI